MELTEIYGMVIGARKSLRANGRYRVGEILHDDNPHIDEVLRVVEVGQGIRWSSERIADEDAWNEQRPGEYTTDIVVERIERSPAGQAVVDAYWRRFREPIKVVAGELRVNHNLEHFFNGSGWVKPLTKHDVPPAERLTPLRTEPVAGFIGQQADVVYALPADGWYESVAMHSPTGAEHYFFEIRNGVVSQLFNVNDCHERYGLHWRNNYEAMNRFREEQGSAS